MPGFDVGAIVGRLVLEKGQWNQSIKQAKEDARSLNGFILNNTREIQKLGLAIGAVGVTITGASGIALKFAADAQESENLFRESMGSMAKEADEWSRSLGRSLGLNQFQIRKTVGTFNVMINSMGLSADAAFEMSKSLTQLSYDIASFYNLSPEEAFRRLQSGISGEVEPLKRLGIIVNETMIKQTALTHGIIRQGEEMTEAQKIVARYITILEATQKAQGDLERTQNSLTNLTRRTTSRFQELAIQIGNQLTPHAEKFMRVIFGMVDWVGKWAEQHQVLFRILVVSTAAIGLMATAMAPLLLILPALAVSSVALNIPLAQMTLTILALTAAVTGLVTAFVLMVDWINKLPPAVREGLKVIHPWTAQLTMLAEGLAKLSGSAETVKNTVKNTFEDLKNSVLGKGLEGTSFENMGEQIKKIFADIQKGAQESFTSMGSFGKNVAMALTDSFETLFYDPMTQRALDFESFFKNFALRILNMIQRIMAEQMTMALLGGGSGGSGGSKGLLAMGLSALGSSFSTALTGGIGGIFSSTYRASQAAATAAQMAGNPMALGPGFAEGTSFVPYTGLAKIHRGERIVPAGENQSGMDRKDTVIEIHNHITPESVARSLQTREGESVITNIVDFNSRNNGVIRRRVVRR